LPRNRQEAISKAYARKTAGIAVPLFKSTVYTIIETAKLNGLGPEAYLATVLDRLASGHLNTRLEDLLPWNLQPQLAAAA